tara:strand:- start:311 stop:613 length:303 start_codon:yes stop_codon:yes gene_type:complete
MESTLNFDNTFVAGSKWMLKIIRNLINKLQIPEATGFFARMLLYVSPSRLGIYALIALMGVVFIVTSPLYAGPNYILSQFSRSKVWVLKRFGFGGALVKR